VGVFQCSVFQQSVFQNDCDGVVEEIVSSIPGGGAGGIPAWRNYRAEKDAKHRRKSELLALVRSSDEYKRLQRKLERLQELLLDNPSSRLNQEKIADIEEQIKMMEWV
jgi:hypothetical protein